MSLSTTFLGQPLKTWSSCNNTAASKVVIFLHGSGDTGPGIAAWVSGLASHLLPDDWGMVFPSATRRPYSLAGGAYTSVWHNRSTADRR